MKDRILRSSAVALALLAALMAARVSCGVGEVGAKSPSPPARPETATTDAWNAKAAAAYLDQRERWWMSWPEAAREHGTFCVSCHTAVPYALARPVLRKALGEQTPTDDERKLLENTAKRVRLWKQIAPVYNDKDDGINKSAESRATEAVLLAFVLANHDAQNGKLSDETRAAFNNLWPLQQTSGTLQGAWLWQLFDLNPWEGSISPYYGATIAAIALGAAPENYRATLEIQNNVKALRDYLGREYSSQPPVNRVMLLWASGKLPGLLAPERQKAIADDILSKQLADGGWSLFPLTRTWRDWGPSSLLGEWKRQDGTPQEMKSDGYATGLVVFVLRQIGLSGENAQLKRGREWLIRNQNKAEGFWLAYSLNKRRDPSSNVGRFMSDAATAYSVLALAN